jgi:hypothetical protein
VGLTSEGPREPGAAARVTDLQQRRCGEQVQIRDLTEYEVAL